MITKIVSGGQTGVDRGALDCAIRNDLEHGGYCPAGRISESGRIPDRYKLTETSSSKYPQRTAMNVQHSDGTLILTRGRPEGGTKKTISICRERGKVWLVIDMTQKLKPEKFVAWVHEHNVRTVNVAGPRASKQSGIQKQASEVLAILFENLTGRT